MTQPYQPVTSVCQLTRGWPLAHTLYGSFGSDVRVILNVTFEPVVALRGKGEEEEEAEPNKWIIIRASCHAYMLRSPSVVKSRVLLR